MPFSCSYFRKTLQSIGFTPISIYFGEEAGYGKFIFKMEFFVDASFTTPYTNKEYSLGVAVNDYVYVKFSVESNSGLVIMAENCNATKDGSVYSWPYYTMIENGCARDSTLDYSYDPTQSFQQFKVKTFRFPEDYNTVYIHCELLACYRYSPNSRCSKGCLNSHKRKKRDLSQDKVEHRESTSKTILTRGPLLIKGRQAAKGTYQKNDSDHSKHTGLIAGVVTACGFVVIAVIALIVFYVKYRMARQFMSRQEPAPPKNEELGKTNPCVHECDITIET